MEVTVFGDLLFFVNFCMDFQCLFLTAKLLHRPFPLWRSAFAAALGAFYAVAALFLETSGLFAFLADCGVCFLMCLFTFAQKNGKIRRILTPFGVYFGVSFAVGGVMSGLASLLSHIEMPLPAGGGDVSSGLFFLLAAAGGLSTFWWGRVCQRRAKQGRAVLRVICMEKTAVFEAFADTGNLLCDPVSGRPVVFLTAEAAAKILPPALLSLRADSGEMTALPPPLARRIRLLPAGTVTGRRLLTAVVPDFAFLDAGRGECPVEILLAVAPGDGKMGSFDALLPATLITE